MKIGTIETEGTGLTGGHPAVIITGKIKAGTVCKTNGLLMLGETNGAFEPYDFEEEAGAACVALEPVAAGTSAARILLHGTFDGSAVVKANGNALTAAELTAVQKHSQIFFI
jgi:hypothetical protein